MAKIAILGFGTVGSGVAEVLTENNDIIEQKLAEKLELKYILDVRDFSGSPFADKMIKDFSVIENDPEIEVVVETIGGAKIAYEFTKRALLSGKHVVTSNKELVATRGEELLQIAKDKNINYMFEASVGGTIPIIRPLKDCLPANRIDEICGILNGTTNFILTRMIKANLEFSDALKEAKELGYAEQDPTADIEGHDACRKICILSDLTYGRNFSPESVYTEGITKITLEDAEYAASGGYVIKLLGRAKLRPDGKLYMMVAPHLIKKECPLAYIEDAFNGIMIKGNACDEVMFYGRGAGKRPTASAVLADVMDAVRHRKARKNIYWNGSGNDMMADLGEHIYPMYYRVKSSSAKIGGVYKIACLLGESPDECAFITEPLSGNEHKERLGLLEKACGVLSKIRVLED
ncbi:MAG: homoserine dehydrogenase [Bacillota bacterium]|nr:homoserine dehydrogenase [Bacillota bacterium]